MGLFDKKQTQTQTSTGTSTLNKTSQRTNPQWVEDMIKGFGGEVSGLGGIDAGSLVPGANPLQTKGFQDAAGLGGMGETFGGALDMTAAAGNSAAPRTEFVKSAPMMSQFMDPYLKDVVETSLADFDFGAGQTRAQQDLDIAGAGAFGGSGAALTKSMTEGELARGRGGLSAGLRSQGWNTALNAAMAEAGRKQGANDLNAGLYGQQLDRTINAGRSLADIGSVYGGEKRADVATTIAAGDAQRGIDTEVANAVPDWLARRIQMGGALPFDLFGGETAQVDGTTTSNSKTKSKSGGSVMDQVGQMAQIAALFASDRRLKRDVVRLDTRPDGLGVYLFRYLWDAVWRIGVMAQEVLKVRPDAVVTLPSGYYAVDYAKL